LCRYNATVAKRDSKMSIVAVVSQKGGVGKSTLCIHLASEAVRKKLRTVILELDRQGTTSLFWSKRRAEALKPDDMVGRIDDNPPQPVVHRVDPSTLMPALEQMRLAGIEFVVLDLPGAHNPAVSMALHASDYGPPPMKWSDSKYGFAIEEDCNGEEETQTGRDRCEVAAG